MQLKVIYVHVCQLSPHCLEARVSLFVHLGVDGLDSPVRVRVKGVPFRTAHMSLKVKSIHQKPGVLEEVWLSVQSIYVQFARTVVDNHPWCLLNAALKYVERMPR